MEPHNGCTAISKPLTHIETAMRDLREAGSSIAIKVDELMTRLAPVLLPDCPNQKEKAQRPIPPVQLAAEIHDQASGFEVVNRRLKEILDRLDIRS